MLSADAELALDGDQSAAGRLDFAWEPKGFGSAFINLSPIFGLMRINSWALFLWIVKRGIKATC